VSSVPRNVSRPEGAGVRTQRLQSAWRWMSARRRALVLSIGLAILACCICCYYVLIARRADERTRLAVAQEMIAEYESAIRAAGEPIAPADFTRLEVADEVNAAVVLQQAFDIRDSRSSPGDGMPSFSPFDPDSVAESLKELVAAAATMEPDPSDPFVDWWDPQFHDPEEARRGREAFVESFPESNEIVRIVALALDRPRCVFTPTADGSGFPFPYLAHMRHFARHFAGRSLVAASAGDANLAVLRLTQVFDLASLLNDDPPLISQLVAIAMYHIGLDALQLMESSAPLTPEARRAVLQRLERIDGADAMTRSLLTERVAIHTGIQAVLSGDKRPEDMPESAAEFLKMPGKLFVQEGTVRFLQLTTHIIDASRMRPRMALSRLRVLEDRIRSAKEPQLLPYAGVLSSMISAQRKHIVIVTYIRATRIGLACELHRASKGAYPRHPAELAPEYLDTVPKDPFTGKSFVLEPGANQLVVRSLGLNGIDDGGDSKWSGSFDDIVWRCGVVGQSRQ
jgi:hypothetical protein